ncbi:hypothetical protein CHIBA101_1374 [Actinomyces sp. Chiba101]|nr:hypothetical protein CHIBA101_1374 [Actinomyces sp. Chiba101]
MSGKRATAAPIARADDGTRTRDPHLGKVMLYQLSHIRMLAPHHGAGRNVAGAARPCQIRPVRPAHDLRHAVSRASSSRKVPLLDAAPWQGIAYGHQHGHPPTDSRATADGDRAVVP